MKTLLPNFVISLAACVLMTLSSFALAQGSNVISDSDVARLRAFIGDAEFNGASSGVAGSSATTVDGVYIVRPGDTLSEIMASQLGDTGVNSDVLQRVIISNNKSAFRRGNPHWLMAGAHLRLPTVADVVEYVVPGQPNQRAGRADEWVRYP
ncbi:MAG: type IV pilus assembly protein FimV [Luminiphilus sp.]|jgi:nucleoid-associated protein YgaU